MSTPITVRSAQGSYQITSYDLIKSVAVIIMLVDHIGYYFFPDELWWRAIGRIGFPIWFFLVGYSSGRGIPVKLLAGGLLLLAANYMTGMAIFPLNALFTIIFLRLTIDWVMAPIMKKNMLIWPIAVILFVLVIPTYIVAEYGTQAMITAMFGYLVRHRDSLQDKDIVFKYMLFALITFILVQMIYFDFNVFQIIAMVAGTMLIRVLLYNFKPISYPELTARAGRLGTGLLRFMGHRTLEIYVVHLILFKIVALLLQDERLAFTRLVLS